MRSPSASRLARGLRGSRGLRGLRGLRSLHASTLPDRAALLDTLMRNPELDARDAADELRWLSEGAADVAALRACVARRAAGEPLQYILGTTDFGPLHLLCRAPTLIPRPETAHVFERFALSLPAPPAPAGWRVLDWCTGSAPVPLLLAHVLGTGLACGVGYDVAPAALALARDNIALLGARNVRVEYGDVFAGAPGGGDGGADGGAAASRPPVWPTADVVTANPPYISAQDYARLPPSVRQYEDARALVAAEHGLAFYARLAALVGVVGARFAAVEIGHGQGRDVARVFGAHGLRPQVWRDQWGRERMVVGERDA